MHVWDINACKGRTGGRASSVKLTHRKIQEPQVNPLLKQYWNRKVGQGFNWVSSPEKGKKSVRFSPFSAYCYRILGGKQIKPRMVKMVKGPWNQRYINELLQFPYKG